MKKDAPVAPRPRVAAPERSRSVREILMEPSTWAGIMSIGAAFATGGASALANPATLSSIGAGLALILTKEGK